MSRGTRLSILGLYNYKSGLFSEMVYPTGFTADQKQTVVGNILTECAELEVLFPDWDACKAMIGLWSKINAPVWDRIYQASLLEYNPIENYNRTEVETTGVGKTSTHSGTDTSTYSGTDTQTVGSSGSETHSGTDTNTNAITSYDSNSLYTHDQDTFKHGHVVTDSSTGSNSTTYGKRESLQHGETINDVENITRNNHTSGNIGVTTSQQMLEQEIEIAAKLNIMDVMVQSFKERFCLLVY